MPRPRVILATLATASALSLTGCADAEPAPATPSTSTRPSLLPVRPTELNTDQVVTCSLLTTDQRAQLKIDRVGVNMRDPGNCSWSVGRGPQSYGWSAGYTRPNDAENAARGPGARVVQVGGFPAVQTSSAGFDPNYGCIYIVDIAADHHFAVAYFNDRKDIPGMNRQKACQQAATVAELTLANLKARAR